MTLAPVRTRVVPPHKVILVYVLLNILMPGFGEVYLGYTRMGALLMATFFISVCLVFAIIGLFTTPFLWLMIQVGTLQTVWRTAVPGRSSSQR